MTSDNGSLDPVTSGAPVHRPPFPVGWFALAMAAEVPEGVLVPVAAFGQSLAVGRTPDGRALVVRASCPHLGADLAAGGRIDDDRVMCPVHEWCFGHDGACVSAAGGPLPNAAKLRVWPTEVVNGIIWAFQGRSGEGSSGPPAGSATPALVQRVEDHAGHPEDVMVGLLSAFGVADGSAEAEAWIGDLPGDRTVVVHGPGMLEVLSGPSRSQVYVTPVDGFTTSVRMCDNPMIEVDAESDRMVLSCFRDWYRRFDQPSTPTRRAARSGRSGRRARLHGA